MTLTGRLVQPRNIVAAENPDVPLTSTTLLDFLGGGTSYSGKEVTETNSLGMPAVWRAVNLIAGTSASLPLHAYRPGAEGSPTIATSGQAADLLATPHPDMTPFELWETVYSHMLLWGNAYLWIGRDALGRIAELWPIHPCRVTPGRVSKDNGRKIYRVDGFDRPLYDDTILHLPAFGYDGICGVSPIRLARQGIGLALAAEEYGAKLFGSGSLATGILQTDQRLTQKQADDLHTRWRAKKAGMQSAHDTIVLDRGATFKQLTIPPEDAQFIESRKFQLQEVARIFGVPPHMLADTEGSTSWGTGIEQQSIGFVVYTLRPWLTRVEQRVSRLLTPQALYARYTVEGLLRGDSAQRAAFYTAMRNLGVFNADEIRGLEERGPIPGGAAYWRPLNMGELGAPSDPAPASTTNEGAPADA